MRVSRVGILVVLLLIASVVGVAAQTPRVVVDAVRKTILEIYVDSIKPDHLRGTTVEELLHPLDPHTTFIPADQVARWVRQQQSIEETVGIEVMLLDGTPLITNVYSGSPADVAGLRPGDWIVAVDGTSMSGLAALYPLVASVAGPEGIRVYLSLRRPGRSAPIDVLVTRRVVEVPAVRTAAVVQGDVGYLRFTTFSQGGAQQVAKRLRELQRAGVRALVLDLRDNGGGLLNEAQKIADLFFPAGTVIAEEKGQWPPANKVIVTEQSVAFDGPLVVLVNGQTASASELLSGALQDWERARLVGERTFGKGLVQIRLQVLPNGDVEPVSVINGVSQVWQGASLLSITIARYYTPKGRMIQSPYTGHDREAYLAQKKTTPGGLLPDVEVSVQEEPVVAFLRSKLLFFRFGVMFVGEYATSLAPTPEMYRRQFRLTDTLFSEFRRFVQPEIDAAVAEEVLTAAQADVASVRSACERFILAAIAGVRWGEGVRDMMLLESDPQAQEALQLLQQ